MSDVHFDLEVDVVHDRDSRPWIEKTHFVQVVVPEKPSWTATENEARNLAAWMCWHVRGEMVTAVRITEVRI
jgi:hypothetical protein